MEKGMNMSQKHGDHAADGEKEKQRGKAAARAQSCEKKRRTFLIYGIAY